MGEETALCHSLDSRFHRNDGRRGSKGAKPLLKILPLSKQNIKDLPNAEFGEGVRG